MERIHNPKGDHIVESRDRRNIPGLLQKLACQIIADLIFRINVGHILVELFPRGLDNHLIPESGLLVFLQESFHALGALLLPGCKRWRDIGYLPMAKFQKVACHDSSQFGVVQFHCIHIHLLILVVNDCHRNLFRQFFQQVHKAVAWVAGVNNSQRAQFPHHFKIPLLHSQVSLGIADKEAESLLFCPGLNSLKQHDIIRVRKVGTKDHQKFLLPGTFFRLALWGDIS